MHTNENQRQPVIFLDWDGTIADSMGVCTGGLTLALQEMGYPVPPLSVLEKCNGPTYEEAADIVGIHPEDKAAFLRHRQEADARVLATAQRLYPGIADILRRLRERAALCIVSNGLGAYIDASMALTGLEKELFTRISAFQPGMGKTEALARLMREMQPERAVMVGDNLSDITAAHTNGLPAMAAAYGYGTPEMHAQAEWIARTPAELEELLTAWCDGQLTCGNEDAE